MTANMQTMIAEAFEAGRVAERALAKIIAEAAAGPITLTVSKATSAPAKSAAAPKTAPARTAKKGTGPRVPGVKQGIMDLIATQAMSPAGIVAATGFKATSVRATLMSLKKAGLAANDDGLWLATGQHISGNGNSEAEVRV